MYVYNFENTCLLLILSNLQLYFSFSYWSIPGTNQLRWTVFSFVVMGMEIIKLYHLRMCGECWWSRSLGCPFLDTTNAVFHLVNCVVAMAIIRLAIPDESLQFIQSFFRFSYLFWWSCSGFSPCPPTSKPVKIWVFCCFNQLMFFSFSNYHFHIQQQFSNNSKVLHVTLYQYVCSYGCFMFVNIIRKCLIKVNLAIKWKIFAFSIR